MELSVRHPRIYLVEDSAILLRLLRELLQSVGAEVIGQADSAPIAMREIRRLRPDVAIVDITLQRGNGFDVLRALAEEKNGDRPVCIVLTNHSSAPYRNAAKRLGAEYFFDKSTEIIKMLKIVVAKLQPGQNNAERVIVSSERVERVPTTSPDARATTARPRESDS
jgi:DNA-binding NarL/FixJ family response regulator